MTRYWLGRLATAAVGLIAVYVVLVTVLIVVEPGP